MHGVPSPTRHLILDPRGAELLFQIITAREERAFDRLRLQRPSPNGATPSPTPDWLLPLSTGSPSTPTSSKPAPAATDSKHENKKGVART